MSLNCNKMLRFYLRNIIPRKDYISYRKRNCEKYTEIILEDDFPCYNCRNDITKVFDPITRQKYLQRNSRVHITNISNKIHDKVTGETYPYTKPFLK